LSAGFTGSDPVNLLTKEVGEVDCRKRGKGRMRSCGVIVGKVSGDQGFGFLSFCVGDFGINV
jgi:hypothetical protein